MQLVQFQADSISLSNSTSSDSPVELDYQIGINEFSKANVGSSLEEFYSCFHRFTLLLIFLSQTLAVQAKFTYCVIRHPGFNFISQTDNSTAFIVYDTKAVPYDYYPTINMFMQNLSFVATPSDKSYAVQQTRFPDTLPVYGSVDCTRDVDAECCTLSVGIATSLIREFYAERAAGWLAAPTCNCPVSPRTKGGKAWRWGNSTVCKNLRI